MAMFVRKISYVSGRFAGEYYIEDRGQNDPRFSPMNPDKVYTSWKSAQAGCAALQRWFNDMYDRNLYPDHAEDNYKVTVKPVEVVVVNGKVVLA